MTDDRQQEVDDIAARLHTVLYPLDLDHRDEVLVVINHLIAAVKAAGQLPDDVAKRVLSKAGKIIGGREA